MFSLFSFRRPPIAPLSAPLFPAPTLFRSLLPCGSGAAPALCLPRRTGARAVRAEHAAVSRLGPKHGATSDTVVEPLAGVGRHRLGARTATERAGDRRLGHHHRRSLLAPTSA